MSNKKQYKKQYVRVTMREFGYPQTMPVFIPPAALDGTPAPDGTPPLTAGRAAALRRLAELRAALPPAERRSRAGTGGSRRESRRWALPDTVTIAQYEAGQWHPVEVLDCGIEGVRILQVPGARHESQSVPPGEDALVLRLVTPDGGTVLALGTVRWRDTHAAMMGVQFEFQTDDDYDAWRDGLLEALLARHGL